MQPLRHKDLVEISDFEIPRFGSVFCFLAQSFTPSLIHTSSPYPNGTFCTPKTTSKQKQFAKQNGQNLVQKPRFANFWSFFFGYDFFNGFFPSASGASRKRRAWNPGSPEATTTASTMRPSRATSRRCGTSSVSIRRKCTRKTSCLAAASKNG